MNRYNQPPVNVDEQSVTKVLALGGLNEIGKNTYCLHHDNEILLIDAGIKFPNKKLAEAGVQGIVPNYRYLVQHADQIKALVITHGHEDHIGGIVYLIQWVNIPIIYAPQLASGLIRHRLKENKHLLKNIPIIKDYDDSSVIQTEYFKISFFPVNHNIPDAFGVAVKTPNGIVINTGDYKFDWTSIGQEVNLATLANLGEQQVQLLMADSTNSEVPGHTISESYIIDNLTILFQKARGRIFFSTFASNVHRFLKVIELAAQFQRKVVIIGRSIERIVNIIRNLGHLQINHDVFVSPDDLEQLPPEKTLVLCTGSQGEPNAALARIARGHLKYVKMQRDDLVLLSSSAIPGNRLAIELLVNDLIKKGAQVLQNTADFPIHTSGHAAKEDQKLMFMLTKPHFFMPIHGDFRMLKAHGQTATEVNVAPGNIFYCSNGDVVYLYQNYAWIGDRVNAEPVYIDNNNRNIDDRAQTLVAERLSLASRGFLTIALVFSDKCQLLAPPVIISRGSFFVQKSGSLMFKLKKSILSFIEQYFKNNNVIHQQFSEDLKNLVSGIVFRAQKRNPVIIPVTITTPATSG